MPLARDSSEISLRTTSYPASALTWAIPFPIWPAPITPIVFRSAISLVQIVVKERCHILFVQCVKHKSGMQSPRVYPQSCKMVPPADGPTTPKRETQDRSRATRCKSSCASCRRPLSAPAPSQSRHQTGRPPHPRYLRLPPLDRLDAARVPHQTARHQLN